MISALAFLSVLAYHDTARWVGLGWMTFGLLFYVVYRKGFEGTTLTKRVTVSEKALTKQVPEVDFRNILVPVFGTKLDDDIVATAGRLAAAEQEEAESGEEETRLDLVYVIEVPLTLPLDADLPLELEEGAQRALKRAREVAEEYADVDVSTEVVRARRVGAGIVESARRYNSEAIVIGGEPPYQDPRWRQARRHRGRQACRDRCRDRVRAEEGAVSGSAHGAAGDGSGGRSKTSGCVVVSTGTAFFSSTSIRAVTPCSF